VNSILLRPLPFKDPDRLVSVWEVNPSLKLGFDKFPASMGDFTDWHDQNLVFDLICAYYSGGFNLTGRTEPQKISGLSVTSDFFTLLGVDPIAGRVLNRDDHNPGADRVVVVSYDFWRDEFGSDSGLIGKTITLNDKTYTVVGIMPRGFNFPR